MTWLRTEQKKGKRITIITSDGDITIDIRRDTELVICAPESIRFVLPKRTRASALAGKPEEADVSGEAKP